MLRLAPCRQQLNLQQRFLIKQERQEAEGDENANDRGRDLISKKLLVQKFRVAGTKRAPAINSKVYLKSPD